MGLTKYFKSLGDVNQPASTGIKKKRFWLPKTGMGGSALTWFIRYIHVKNYSKLQ
jgi:hypothetical protein